MADSEFDEILYHLGYDGNARSQCVEIDGISSDAVIVHLSCRIDASQQGQCQGALRRRLESIALFEQAAYLSTSGPPD